MTIGERLRAARESKGMSIGDIARRTFIQLKFLQAIDRDDFAAIPDSHRRLFVREYAKVVGVDANQVLALLEDSVVPEPVVEAPPDLPTSTSRASRRAAAQQTAAAAAPVSESERREYSEILRRLSAGKGVKLSGPNTSSWLIGIALILLILSVLYYMLFVHDAADTPTQVKTGDTTNSQAEILSGDSTPAAAAPVERNSDDSLTLEGRSSSNVWFSIVMDGKRSDTGTLDSGESRIWRAAETFKLSLGNAGGLELTLNDSLLGALGPKRSIVRSQIIDAHGVRSRTAPAPRRPAGNAAPARQNKAPQMRQIAPSQVREPVTPP
jgi:cytoskeletal protein RodZ